MELKVVGVDKKKSHIKESGFRVIFFELSGNPDDKWISFFDFYYANDPNRYKGNAAIIDNKYIRVTTDYHNINQVKDCVISAVQNANNDYRKMLNDDKIKREQRNRILKEQEEKRNREYQDFKVQLDNLDFNEKWHDDTNINERE